MSKIGGGRMMYTHPRVFQWNFFKLIYVMIKLKGVKSSQQIFYFSLYRYFAIKRDKKKSFYIFFFFRRIDLLISNCNYRMTPCIKYFILVITVFNRFHVTILWSFFRQFFSFSHPTKISFWKGRKITRNFIFYIKSIFYSM